MPRTTVILLLGAIVGGDLAAQTNRNWTSDSDQRWSRNANWSGSNRPDGNNEVAVFGAGPGQLNPLLNANNYAVRGLRFGAGAGSYQVGDDNGSRTLRIGNAAGGFIESYATSNQAIDITNLQFQGDMTISTLAAGNLSLGSNLSGNNRDLTFNATGDILVSGSIATGTGTLTKTGTGNLTLAGSTSYTGATAINAGAIVLGANDVFANAGAINVAIGASLKLNNLTDVIGQLGGAGTVDFGASGNGQLTLGSGVSAFGGSFAGSGRLVIGAGASLVLDADFANSNLTVVLDGGSLLLSGHQFTLGSLQVAQSSMIDFGAAANSTLTIAQLGFDTTAVILTAQNWSDAADYFYSQAAYNHGSAPLNQVQFTGWTTADTRWQSYDQQITPVPEPRAYGILVIGLTIPWLARRRLRSRAGPDRRRDV